MVTVTVAPVKPFLRNWSHALAAVATLARLRRVNAALAAWDAHEAALARPDLFTVPEPPSVSREGLRCLRRELVAALAEQAAMWDRRH